MATEAAMSAVPRTAVAVLVVRASTEDVQRVEHELRRGGYEPSVLNVQTEGGLMAALEERGWDLVLVYSAHPHSTLREVVRLLRDREIDPAVVAITPSLADEAVVSAVKMGAHDCLFKTDLRRLASAADHELAEASRRRSAAETERQRQQAEQRYKALIDEIPALTYLAWADAVGSRVYVSAQIKTMTGYTQAEWLAEADAWLKLIHPDDRDRVLAEYRRCVSTGDNFLCEYRALTREGKQVWWRDEARFLPDASGQPSYLRGLVVDITDRKEAQEALRQLTYRDPLTGLPNRALMQERLYSALRHNGQPLALLMMNLDRFREVNNTLGHHNGDLVLQEVGQRLRDVLGDGERAARLRGDEFGILLPGGDAALAQQVAAKILKALHQPIMVERLPIELGASIGIAAAPEHARDDEMLLRRADLAMQSAKRLGSSVVVYTPECDPYNPHGLVLLSELRRALEADQLTLHYQPKVDLKKGKVIGAEALVRWKHPKRGLVPPDQFIGLAEQGGLIKPLTRWVLHQALLQSRHWPRNGGRLPVSVNLSARNLHDPTLADQVSELLDETQSVPQDLALEITESAMMADPPRAAQTLHDLQGRGVELSVDDFGTGYSSLAYLSKLPVHEIKIDKSFVMGMAARKEEDTVIVRSTNDLGHNLGLKVVAEGVEDRHTFDMLGSFGCDAAQGFYMARPMASSDLGTWLRESPWKLATH
jgi:diguanylate cyclase (GGDEF)-like protein/PAS domain S-box-containing protein